MPSFTMHSPTLTTIQWSVRDLGSPFNTNNYQRMTFSTGTTPEGSLNQPSGIVSRFTIEAYSPSTYSRNYLDGTFTGLNSDQRYEYYCYVKSTNERWYPVGYDYATTVAPAPSLPAIPLGFSAYATGQNEIRLSWSSATRATGYIVRCSTLDLQRTTSSTELYWGGLSPGTTYTFYVRSTNSYGQSGWSSSDSATTESSLGSPVFSLVRANSNGDIYASWSRPSGATSFYVYLDGYYYTETTLISITFPASALEEYTVHDINVQAVRSGETSTSAGTSIRTVDRTPPSIYMTSGYPTATASTITVKWSANDIGSNGKTGSGISHFRAYIGTSYVTLDSSLREYTYPNLNGDVSYNVRVVAYDNANQSTTTTTYTITTESGKPTGYTWSTSKISGQPFKVLASEWLALQQKVNEFRQYRKLTLFSFYDIHNGDYSFTRPYIGNIIRDFHFNQVRNAIADMTTSYPSLVSTGNNIRAGSTTTSNKTDGLNGLVNALNSVT